jgi:hypothetical protein
MRGRFGGDTLTKDMVDLRADFAERGGWFDNLLRKASNDHVTRQNMLSAWMWHIAMAQRAADVPTWLGQYMKSQAAGENEERAIALADQAVLSSQGGGQLKDLSKIERGGPIARAFLTFYSYGGTVYNATARRAEMTNRSSATSIARFIGGLGLLYIMPAVYTAAMKRLFGKGGDDDDWTEWVKDIAEDSITQALNGIVIARELADPGSRGYSGPAGLRPIQIVYQFARQVNQGKLDKGLFDATVDIGGVTLGFPSAQTRRSIDGWIALQSGRTNNPGVLLVGPAPHK